MAIKYIEKFGSKLMVSSKSINKIPYEYMQISENARIYDGGIWPRRGKSLIIESVLWTNNKGGFIMWGKLYQIANSKIYEIDVDAETQTEIATLWYDEITDILVYETFAIIVSTWQALKVFDWTVTIITPATVPAWDTWWIIEYTRWYSFYAIWNILYISRPITSTNPEYAYDFTWSGSQNIPFDSPITGLQGTMNGIYIFTEKKVEFIGANSLQNIAWSATFISSPLWDSWAPINNLAIAASGDKIFYVTKNLQVQTVNFISWTADATIWELSAVPVVSIKEFLNTIDEDQPQAFWFYNKNDKTIQFHLRTKWFPFNNIVLIYDLINDTWNVDSGKNFNYIVENWFEYYWFSDINTNIYKDDVTFSDAWIPIGFRIKTQAMNQGIISEKKFQGFWTAGWVWFLTELGYNVSVDWESVFNDVISGNLLWINEIWEIWGVEVWWEPIWWDFTYSSELNPFERTADVWRIDRDGKRVEIEITSTSQIQDFILDMLWVDAIPTWNVDIRDKF